MALRISIGQYYDGDSPLHRMDPRAKVAAALVVMVVVFFVRTPVQLAVLLAGAAALLAVSHVPARKVMESIRPLVAILVVLGLLNLLFVRTGTVVAQAGPLVITTDGLWDAVCYPLRFSVAILIGALLMLTTTPTQLTDAFEAALAPLSRVGLPGHELAMVFSLMLRFIPTIADEASAIVDAQAARGGALDEGSLGRRLRAIGSVLVALLASAIHHANGLARALDARCYEGGAARTQWKAPHMRPADWAELAVCAAYVALLLAA